jgi:mannose-6-phosphate isomerase-like protein (cupin superfamily)
VQRTSFVSLLLLLVSVPAAAQSVADSSGVVAAAPDGFAWAAGSGGFAAAEFALLLGSPGREGPFAFRLRMPADWTMPPHTHGTAEHITVLSGTLTMRFAPDGERLTLGPGSFVSIPAGVPMWAWTGAEPVTVQIHGVGPLTTEPVR